KSRPRSTTPVKFFDASSAGWRAELSDRAEASHPIITSMSERKYFGKLREGAEPPNLIEVQLDSYVEFLQTDVTPSKRKVTGLQAVFKEVFPITSYDEKVPLDFASYDIGEPKLSIREAM